VHYGHDSEWLFWVATAIAVVTYLFEFFSPNLAFPIGYLIKNIDWWCAVDHCVGDNPIDQEKVHKL
jgi:hypothetical protein